jgi:hypothetical protein
VLNFHHGYGIKEKIYLEGEGRNEKRLQAM